MFRTFIELLQQIHVVIYIWKYEKYTNIYYSIAIRRYILGIQYTLPLIGIRSVSKKRGKVAKIHRTKKMQFYCMCGQKTLNK